MTVSYRLHNNIRGQLVCVIRTSSEDNMQYSIPIDEDNSDYKKYLEWVAEGNTAESDGID